MMFPCEVIKMLKIEDDKLLRMFEEKFKNFIDWLGNFDAINSVDEIEKFIGLIEGCAEVEVPKNVKNKFRIFQKPKENFLNFPMT